MADVADPTRFDRGQLLLVTALALAVILVTVALLLNAAIFTENTATRDTTADGHEAIELRGEVVQAVGELIETENRAGSGSETAVESGINATGEMVDRERARGGTIATVDHDPNEIETGTLLRYNGTDGGSRLFSDGGENNWTLVDDPGSARALVVTIEPETLAESTAESSDEAFGVRFNSSAATDVTLHIYDDGGDQLAVARAEDGGTPERLCRIEHDGSTAVDIDITGDRLSTDGATVGCYRGLWPDNDPEKIEFVTIGQEAGTASVTVDDDDADSEIDGTDAVYAATVDIGYRTTDLTFETTARIAPGEPR